MSEDQPTYNCRTTHYLGCDCHEAQMNAEIATLRAELERVTAERDELRLSRDGWQHDAHIYAQNAEAADGQVVELRSALEGIIRMPWMSVETAKRVLTRTPSERQRHIMAVVDAAREVASRPALPRGMEGRDITKLRDALAALDDGKNGESDD